METINLQKTQLYGLSHAGQQKLLAKSGVYIFRKNMEVQYVGCSSNLSNRLNQHLMPSGISNMFEWNNISVVFCDNYFEVEKFYINELKPKHNGGITTNLKIKTNTGYVKGKLASFRLRESVLNKLKSIAYWDRLQIQDVMNDALEQYIKNYEEQKGVVKSIFNK